MKSLNRKQLAAAILLATGSATALAQTSSSIRGVVTGPDGQPAQASVTIIHTPSGSVSDVETNENGRFVAKGLRVGGPYRIIVDSDVYADDIEEDVYLQLGKAFKFNSQLSSEQVIEEVMVVGSATALERNTGGSSLFGLDTIERAPNMDRDISAYIRMNPLVNVDGGAISIAGSNNRLNSFTVDGIAQNDSFGLSDNGYPTGRSPISMEAIEQVSVDYSPYNVKAGGFSGGLINAVTKSGTNEFHGSVFIERQNEGLSGGKITQVERNQKDELVEQRVDIPFDFEERTRGGFFSGPLIKDKLFFFVSYEDWKSPSSNNWGPAGSGSFNQTNFSLEEYNQVRDAAENLYGLTLGGWEVSPVNTDEKILVKLDWNINDNHRADFTYQNTESVKTNNFTQDDEELVDITNVYTRTSFIKSYAFGVYSDWTDNFSTELRASLKDSGSRTPPNTYEYGEVLIQNSKGDELVFGAERNRHANSLNDDAMTFEFSGEYLLGDHSLTAGFSYRKNEAFNIYMPNSLGTWNYRNDRDTGISGIDVFTGKERDLNGNLYAPEVNYTNAITGNPIDAAADFSVNTYALYAQDEFQVSDQLELTFGLRYERLGTSDVPNFNTKFNSDYGFSNQATVDGVDIILPRIGFEYRANDSVTISGGVGRFSGGQPNVWVGNTYSKDGVTRFDAEIENLANPDFRNINSELTDSIASQAQASNGPTVALDPNFKLPSEWRSSLNLDVVLPYEINWHVGVEKAWKQDSLNWENLSKRNATPIKTAADGRALYRKGDIKNFDLLMTNTDTNGKSTIVTTSLQKFWDNGLSASVSYTNQDITAGLDNAGSSNAESLYKFNPSVVLGEPLIGQSVYEVEHRFTANLSYRADYFDGFASSFNLFFERRPGENISYIMEGDDLRELAYAEALLPYIPNGPEDTSIVSNADEIWGDLQAIGLDQYAGGYAEKNGFRAPWYNSLDFGFQQEIPNVFLEGHKGILSLTMENVLSFLDDKGIWENDLSHRYDYSYSTQRALKYSVEDDGRYTYEVNSPSRVAPSLQERRSGWQVKLGLRYSF